MGLSFSDLSKKYRDFGVPTLKIKSGGKEIPLKELSLKNVEVHLSTGFEASMASFEVYEIYDLDARKFDSDAVDSYFTVGKTVEIYLGYIETSMVFKGYIESVKAIFSEGSFPHLQIECLDVKGLMMHGKKSVVMNLTTVTDAVSKILGTYGTLAGTKTADSCTTLKREIQQNNETDYAFLCRVAKVIHYEFFVLNGEVFFRKPKYAETSPLVTFEWGGMLLDFSVEQSLAKFVGKVTVKGYDDTEHKVIESTAQSATKVGSGSKKPDQLASQLSHAATVIIDYEIGTVEEAKERAAAELDARSMAFLTARGKTVGLPDLLPGKFIEIKNLDPTVDKSYYVTSVVHRFNNGDYYTEFSAGANQL